MDQAPAERPCHRSHEALHPIARARAAMRIHSARLHATLPRMMRRAVTAMALASLLEQGCAARPPIARQPRQAVMIINAGSMTDICRVRVRAEGMPWRELGPIDPIAPGRSRTLRVPHGRWQFRFEACERAAVLNSPPVDISFTRVVFMLCDGECDASRAPAGAVVVRHNALQDDWGISEPVYVPTGRRRWRFVL